MNVFNGHPWRVVAAMGFLLVVALMLSLTVFGGPEPVRRQEPMPVHTDICHLYGQRYYRLISVDNQNLELHLSHGDRMPGTDVLDQNCMPDTDGDGVADAEDNCPVTPNVAQSDRYGSSKGDACEDDSNGDGVLDVDEPNICVSIDGVDILLRGSSHCESSPSTGFHPNIAVAHGEFADAGAYSGDNNTATADGTSATAYARNGDNNTAIADGSCIVVVEFTSDSRESCEGTDVGR